MKRLERGRKMSTGCKSRPGWLVLCVLGAAGLGLLLPRVRARGLKGAMADPGHEQILLFEVQHRARNQLSIVQAMARRIFTADNSSLGARSEFQAALDRLAATQDLPGPGKAASLDEILARELCQFETQVKLCGPDVRLNPRAAQNFSLIAHELCTNAMKHGALSCAQGRVAVEWRRSGRRLRFCWREQGGPAVKPPTRKGFGSTMLYALAKPLASGIAMDFRNGGFEYRFDAKWPLVRMELARMEHAS